MGGEGRKDERKDERKDCGGRKEGHTWRRRAATLGIELEWVRSSLPSGVGSGGGGNGNVDGDGSGDINGAGNNNS
jgi:hypothetical protein